MNLRTAIAAIVVAVTGAYGEVGQARDTDKPSFPSIDPPAALWRESLQLPGDPFLASGMTMNEPGWAKFTIVLHPDGPRTVVFQNGHEYPFHYHFAVEHLEPFLGMTPAQYDQVTLYREGREAVLGAVVVSPLHTLSETREYGIQLVGLDPYTREEVLDFFELIRQSIETEEEYRAFYFPTYEQRTAAQADRAWLEEHGVFISSTDRWADDNTVYSSGWALGRLKYVEGRAIREAYLQGTLTSGDILLTDGVPAEVPLVAGIITLSPSTPNSHVAILAKTSGIPFVHLLLPEGVSRAQALIGHRICLAAYDRYGLTSVRLIDTEGILDESTVQEILALKAPPVLDISPITPLGIYGASVDALVPDDIGWFGGKSANFGMLRRAIGDSSPVALGLSFDLWSEFLDQPLPATGPLVLEPGEHILFWADGEPERGRLHTNFRLSADGEAVGLFDIDGVTPIDTIEFGPQQRDISFGRSVDAGDTWTFFAIPTPGQPNTHGQPAPGGLVINEFMASNGTTIENPAQSGEYSDWIELYNASDQPIVLDGMFLTEDLSRPTKWQIQPATSGQTLREEIAQRLSGFTYPPSDVAVLSSTLAGIRALFTNAALTDFTEYQKQAILSLLQDPQYGFDPFSNLRFRSSTNVEDGREFTGAGLYESFSGCLADDLDDDPSGPCLCDPSRAEKRGVFTAIRRVFASFYNENAYIERLRHSIDEDEAGMAILVHHSFPDEFELANGVALVKPLFGSSWEVELTTQLGAVSVTNPEDGSIPEEVIVSVYSFGSYAQHVRQSNLVPLGGKVMTWEDDYEALAELLIRIAEEFAATTGRDEYVLEMEYKKLTPGGAALPAGGLVVKQVREVPQPDTTPSITPFLVAEPTQYVVLQGEFSNVFANHRLKSRWQLQTRSCWLTAEDLGASLYDHGTVEYTVNGRLETLSGSPSQWPQASYRFNIPTNDDSRPDRPIGELVMATADAVTTDSWRLDEIDNPRTYKLHTTGVPTLVSPAESAVLTLQDLGHLTLEVEYERPVLQWDWMGTTMTRTDEVRLTRAAEPSPDDLFQRRRFEDGKGVVVEIEFYWPPYPKGPTAGYTAPLARWVETRIIGYTSEPVVLRGYYSQTYRPEHHNFSEHFLFEPELEPDLAPEVLAELREKDIRLIHVHGGMVETTITTYGFD